MKSTKKHFVLEAGEILITPEVPDADRYSVFLDDKKLDDIAGIIRFRGNTKNEKH